MDGPKNYMGIPGAEFIWNGNTSDAEVLYKGIYLNEWKISTSIWEDYRDWARTNHHKATDDGFDMWLKKHPEYAIELLEGKVYNILSDLRIPEDTWAAFVRSGGTMDNANNVLYGVEKCIRCGEIIDGYFCKCGYSPESHVSAVLPRDRTAFLKYVKNECVSPVSKARKPAVKRKVPVRKRSPSKPKTTRKAAPKKR